MKVRVIGNICGTNTSMQFDSHSPEHLDRRLRELVYEQGLQVSGVEFLEEMGDCEPWFEAISAFRLRVQRPDHEGNA